MEDREFLDNSTLRSTVIRNWTDENFLYAIFFRLNSGSLPLSPQELRKALIGGNLLDAIEQYLGKSTPFKAIFGQDLDKRMRDSELVLRFIAYDRALENYRGDFKEFLDETTRFFETDWEKKAASVQEALRRLDQALTASYSIFGRDSFKKWLGDKPERVINRAIFDCIARYFAEPVIAKIAVSKRTSVIAAFHKLCLEREFRDAIEKTPKTVHAKPGRWTARIRLELCNLTAQGQRGEVSKGERAPFEPPVNKNLGLDCTTRTAQSTGPRSRN